MLSSMSAPLLQRRCRDAASKLLLLPRFCCCLTKLLHFVSCIHNQTKYANWEENACPPRGNGPTKDSKTLTCKLKCLKVACAMGTSTV